MSLKCTENDWLSFDIHYHNPSQIDEFLKKISLYLSNDSFFFVRLLEENPVLKLRIRSEYSMHDIQIFTNSNLNNNFIISKEEYRNQYAFITSTNGGDHKKVTKGVYQREYQRYGGQEMIDLIEENFVISSKIISSKLPMNGIEKLSLSCALTTLLLLPLNMKPMDFDSFCRGARDTWIEYVNMESNEAFDIEVYKNVINNTLKSIEEDYFNNINFENYKNNVNSIYKRFNKSENINFISIIKTPNYDYRLNKIDEKYSEIVRILFSLIHMNNNRLGIYPNAEIIFYEVFRQIGRFK